MAYNVEEITVDVLDSVADQWEETRLRNLVRDEVTKLGREYRRARVHESRTEARCMLRARRLFVLGFERKEIAQLFGVERRLVNKWTKGMDE